MELRNITDINYADYNPRILSEHDGKALDGSMTTFGDIAGITFNTQTNTLVTGHQRLRLLRKKFGDQVRIQREQINEAPDDFGTVATGHVIVDGTTLAFAYREVSWNPAIEKAANIAANRIEADWDKDLLAKLDYELSQLENGAELLALTGQTEDEISKLLDSVGAGGDDAAEDEAPEVDEVNPPVSKLGEIYQLGTHRLMCGSATDYGQVTDLLNGAVPNLLFTDPPYGIDIVGANGGVGGGTEGKYEPIIGDADTTAARDSYAVCKELGIKNMIIWGGNYFTDFLTPTPCWLIWDKQGGKHVTFADVEMAWTSFSKPARLFTHIWDGFRRDSEVGEMRVHPTQKPVQLLGEMLADYSSREDKILDLFGGSGSTLIACDKMGRTCYMMELAPAYIDVIRKRYAKHIGQEADWQAVTPCINQNQVAA